MKILQLTVKRVPNPLRTDQFYKQRMKKLSIYIQYLCAIILWLFIGARYNLFLLKLLLDSRGH